MREYWMDLDVGDVLGESFLAAVIGALFMGPVGIIAFPLVNLALHLWASLCSPIAGGRDAE
jgi:hypothetical protein